VIQQYSKIKRQMASAPNTISTIVKRSVIAVMLLSGATLLAFGPRPNDKLPADSVIVEYWEKWGGAEEEAMRQIVDDFNATIGRQKHIFVHYLSTSSIEQKTLVACAAGTPPDIAGLYNQDVPQFGALNALEPLDDLASEHGITAATYKKVYWDEGHYDDHLYGLVSSAYDIALFYNTAIFHEHAAELRARGLDPDRAPQSIAELDQYAQAFNKISSSGQIDFAGYIPAEPGWYLNYTCIWFGGSWWNERTHKFTFLDPGVVRGYEWVNSYAKRLGPQRIAEFQSGFGQFDSPTNAFLAPLIAMVQHGTFFANFIAKKKPEMAGQWAAAPFPSDNPNLKDVTYCNCDVLSIPRMALHKKEAFEFIAFVNSQREMEKLANLQGKISPLSAVSEGFLEHHSNPYIRVFDRLAASPNAHPTEPMPILQQVADDMNDFHQRLALQQVTVKEGLQQLQVGLQQKYDQFMSDQEQRQKLQH
jgi:multiple sugar transport system substrate-binding protein